MIPTLDHDLKIDICWLKIYLSNETQYFLAYINFNVIMFSFKVTVLSFVVFSASFQTGKAARVALPDNQAFQRWNVKAYSLFGLGVDLSYEECHNQLEALVEQEKEVNRERVLFPARYGNSHTGRKLIDYYIYRWKQVVRLTSLARKRKTLSENLLDLMNNSLNACSYDEINNLREIGAHFKTKIGLLNAFTKVLSNQVTNCQDRLDIALLNPFKLLGGEDVDRVMQLFEIERATFNRLVGWQNLGNQLAKFLYTLNHPSFDSLNIWHSSARDIIRDVYLGEILDPCRKVCNLGEANKTVSKLITYLDWAPDDLRRVKLDKMFHIVEAACRFMNLDPHFVTAEILFNLKRNFQQPSIKVLIGSAGFQS